MMDNRLQDDHQHSLEDLHQTYDQTSSQDLPSVILFESLTPDRDSQSDYSQIIECLTKGTVDGVMTDYDTCQTDAIVGIESDPSVMFKYDADGVFTTDGVVATSGYRVDVDGLVATGDDRVDVVATSEDIVDVDGIVATSEDSVDVDGIVATSGGVEADGDVLVPDTCSVVMDDANQNILSLGDMLKNRGFDASFELFAEELDKTDDFLKPFSLDKDTDISPIRSTPDFSCEGESNIFSIDNESKSNDLFSMVSQSPRNPVDKLLGPDEYSDEIATLSIDLEETIPEVEQAVIIDDSLENEYQDIDCNQTQPVSQLEKPVEITDLSIDDDIKKKKRAKKKKKKWKKKKKENSSAKNIIRVDEYVQFSEGENDVESKKKSPPKLFSLKRKRSSTIWYPIKKKKIFDETPVTPEKKKPKILQETLDRFVSKEDSNESIAESDIEETQPYIENSVIVEPELPPDDNPLSILDDEYFNFSQSPVETELDSDFKNTEEYFNILPSDEEDEKTVDSSISYSNIGKVRSQKTTEDSISESQSYHENQPIIVGSGLKSSMLNQILALTCRVGGKVVDQVSCETTHLIVNVNDEFRASRTTKYLKAILHGMWIVSFDWILASIKDEQYALENNYEVEGDCTFIGGPKKARLKGANIGLFKGYELYFHGKEYGSNLPGVDLLKELFILGKGKILDKMPSLPTNILEITQSKAYVLSDPNVPDKMIKTIFGKTGGYPISSSWILDCISKVNNLDIQDYEIYGTTNFVPFETQNSIAW
eukprot:TRINITY_DN9440_c0_g1_i1.p1 TRINITY_DN9440_c0_g1~~TRINITY_DN9440_c0_g1_i1.p1  ORF type:complete len:766 (+),score=238.11 TRINITY_DN9440_c0_g1_i1:48-2345(+)